MIIGASFYVSNYGFGVTEILFIVATYYVCNISIGVGMHRLWAHNAFKAHPVVEFVLSLTCAATLQGPVLAWSSDHSLHHTFTDKQEDPHSPTKFKSKLLGFFWSHMGWMLFSKNLKSIDRGTLKRLGRNKIVMWQFKNYWTVAFVMNFIVPVIIGLLIDLSLQYALAALLFMGIGRAIQQQATFMVNSVCHFLGTKEYQNGTAGDIPWLFFALLGENWHNFHHAFARDYRNGHKWYHLDIHKWIIFGLEKCGLAHNLVRTPQERIEAKRMATSAVIKEDTVSFLENASAQATLIANIIKRKIGEIDKDALKEKMNASMKAKLHELEVASSNLVENIKQIINDIDESIVKQQKKLQQKISDKLRYIEESAVQMNVELPKLLCYIKQ